MITRRAFLSIAGLMGAGSLFDRRARTRAVVRRTFAMCNATLHRARATGTHPEPRSGITGAKVLTRDKLGKWPDLQTLFDGIRAIPAVADGVRCSCGCAELPGYYSLLSCYEGDAMATICPICQGTGRLVVRLHGEGQSLAQIRVAVDAQFG